MSVRLSLLPPLCCESLKILITVSLSPPNKLSMLQHVVLVAFSMTQGFELGLGLLLARYSSKASKHGG